MIMYIILFIFSAYLTLFLHEFAHYVALKIAHIEITSFKPYPHRNEGKLYFGCVYFNIPRLCESGETLIPIYSASLWKGFVLLIFWMWMALNVWLPLCIFAATEFIDCIYWWFGFFTKREGSDGKKVRELSGWL